MTRYLLSKFAAILVVLYISNAFGAETLRIVVFDDIMISIPPETTVKGHSTEVNWEETKSLSSLIPSDGKITLLPGQGIEINIGTGNTEGTAASESEKYVQTIQKMSRAEWINWLTNMNRALIFDIQNRKVKGAGLVSGDQVGNRYRAMLARSVWYEGEALQNLAILDVFHKKSMIGFTLKWSGPEGGEGEKLADQILSSIALAPDQSEH